MSRQGPKRYFSLQLSAALRGTRLLSLPQKGKYLNAQGIFHRLNFLLYSFALTYLHRGLGNHIKSLICTYATYLLSLSGTLKESLKLGEQLVLSYLFILAARLHQLKLPLAQCPEKTAWVLWHLDLLKGRRMPCHLIS